MSHWMPSLNALRAFEAVSRHLNYHKAAQELSVTPAAVKQLVTKLESSLGAQLVRRKGRGLELTARGASGVGDLSSAMNLLEISVRKMRRSAAEKQVFVSVESSFATAWLVPRLESFRAQHPDVAILIDSNQAIGDLSGSHIDVAIRYGVKSQSGLIVHRLFDDEVFPACSPTLAAGPPTLNELADLEKVPLIHWNLTHLTWAEETRKWFTWEGWLKRANAGHVSTAGGLHFSEYGQAVQAAIAGQGMLLASWPILREPLEAGRLIAPFDQSLTTDIGYEMVATTENGRRPEVAAFIEWLLSAVD